MIEQRFSTIVSALVAFLVVLVLWNAFVRRSPVPDSSAITDSLAGGAAPAAQAPAPLARDSTAARGMQAPPALPPSQQGLSYMELLGRSETRRRIRASAGHTYLNEVVVESGDSMLRRWDDRVSRPVRVFIGAGTVANFQPSFSDAVRAAFQRWREAGVPVRFNLDADSALAEVYVRWRVQFDIERTGQTDLTWDEEGHLVSGVLTLATFDPKGRPLGPDDIRVVALHEVGHLIGLDHSSDSTDLMYAATGVRDLSARDIASATLLYQLPPGSLR